jgi:hypothetical protein
MAAKYNPAIHQVRQHLTVLMGRSSEQHDELVRRSNEEHKELMDEFRTIDLLLSQADAVSNCPLEDACPLKHPEQKKAGAQ